MVLQDTESMCQKKKKKKKKPRKTKNVNWEVKRNEKIFFILFSLERMLLTVTKALKNKMIIITVQSTKAMSDM